MLPIVFVFVVATAANAYFLRPEFTASLTMYSGLAGTQIALATYAIYSFWNQGTLGERLLPKGGDIGVGGLLGLILVGASWPVRSLLASAESGREAWLRAIYWQAGSLEKSLAMTALLLLTAAASEIVWRGLVLDRAQDRFGPRRGWVVAALFYAASYLPTVYTLRLPRVGYNPMLMLAAFGTGIVWSFLAARSGRLPMVMISHMVFAYFAVSFAPAFF